LQFGDAIPDLAAVHLGMGFSGAPAADAAALPPLGPRQLGRLPQARGHVAEPGDFHLGAGSPGAGVAVEYLEDDHGAVHDLAAGFLFEVAGLGRRNLVVHQQDIYPPGNGADCLRRPLQFARPGLIVHEAADLLPLAGTQVGRRIEAGAFLHKGADDLEAQGLCQFPQFVQGGIELGIAHVRQLHGRHDSVSGFFFRVCLHQYPAAPGRCGAG